MVRTIRIKTEEYYKELLKVQGELQAKKGETQTYNLASPSKLRDALNRPMLWQSVKKGNRATIYHELNVSASLSPYEPISHIIIH